MLRIALILGLLAAVGPFAIDMYLPALPAISEGLGVAETAVQQTLTFYFLAFGASQLVYGPLADQWGRKPPIYLGLALFGLASLGCALAPSVEWLTFFRFVQGLGGAAIMVIPRAIIRDLYTGAEATRLMATVMLVISVSPMLAPLAGAGMLAIAGWRSIFWVLAGVAVFSLVVARFGQEETLPPERRVPINLRSMMRGGRVLLRDPIFMGLTFVGGFGMASFFVFISSAAFVYADQFGLTPTQFSLAFAVNAIGFFGASQMAAPLGMRHGMVRVMGAGVMLFAGATSLLLVLALMGQASLFMITAFLFIGNAGLGVVIPTSMVMALDPHGEIAGLASSLGGTMQMLAGGVMIALAAPFFDGTALPMLATIAICGWAALGLAALTLPRLTGPAEGADLSG